MTEREALKLALEALKQIDEAMPFPVAKLAQAAIKEALAQPEQTPYITMPPSTPMWTIPPQRKPLTDEEILTYRYMIDWTAEWSYINFARAIEAAHGIKGEA